MRVIPVVVEPADLQSAIARYHRADSELIDLSSTLTAESDDFDETATYTEADDAAPIVRFVNLLVSQAIQDKASDIHIEPGEGGLRVRYRIDGVLHDMQNAPSTIAGGVTSRIKIMSDLDIAERRKPQDGRMSVHHNGRTVDLRVAILPTVWGEKVVLRILDNATSSMSMNGLNLLTDNFNEFEMAYTKPYGMILVTGPTGSGKSTTLYTTLHAISRPEINVITVEDPVEYRMPGVNQVQVNRKAGLTFAVALRSILRSDPDVVLLGEIRDQETAKIAIEASLTGHLVLSTLHTNDAPSAMTRLIEMGVEPFLVGIGPGLRGGPATRPSAVRPLQGSRQPHRPGLSGFRGQSHRWLCLEPLHNSARARSSHRPHHHRHRDLQVSRMLELLADRIPRSTRHSRGHDGIRGDRAPHRRTRFERPDRSRRAQAGHDHHA
jgi:type IV pilus assembly protein PilB